MYNPVCYSRGGSAFTRGLHCMNLSTPPSLAYAKSLCYVHYYAQVEKLAATLYKYGLWGGGVLLCFPELTVSLLRTYNPKEFSTFFISQFIIVL